MADTNRVVSLCAHIPEYIQLPAADARSLRRAAHVDPEFVQASIDAVGENSGVANLLGRSAPELRQETVDDDRWNAVQTELQAMLNGVAAANLVRRHRIGLTALQVYNICGQLVRQKENATLLPRVQQMKRLNKFGKKHPKAGEGEPRPTPA